MYNYKEQQKKIKTFSDDLNLSHPRLKELALKFLDAFKNETSLKGYTVKITQTLRSTDYQNSLYNIGRNSKGDVIGKVVTNAKGSNSMHEYGLAFDYAIYKDGVYMTGENVAKGSEQYKMAGAIGKKLGLFWGGDFKGIYDAGHFQYTGKYDNNTALYFLKRGNGSDFIVGV